jgi:hypothetical protein
VRFVKARAPSPADGARESPARIPSPVAPGMTAAPGRGPCTLEGPRPAQGQAAYARPRSRAAFLVIVVLGRRDSLSWAREQGSRRLAICPRLRVRRGASRRERRGDRRRGDPVVRSFDRPPGDDHPHRGVADLPATPPTQPRTASGAQRPALLVFEEPPTRSAQARTRTCGGPWEAAREPPVFTALRRVPGLGVGRIMACELP